MKYILLVAAIVLTLNAQIDKKEMYAQVKSVHATLYHKPYECADKKIDYYKHGDMIEIEYCNKYRWCKTPKGFVKKDLLRLPEQLRKEDKPMPSSLMIPREVKHIKKVELIAEPVIINETSTLTKVTPIAQKSVKKDAYDEYFSGESAKVIFKEK